MTLIHSCCPGKTNIQAPEFKLKETLHLKKGTYTMYECLGCRTEVHIIDIPKEPTP